MKEIRTFLLFCSILIGYNMIGNECRQIIDERFYDLSLLKSDQDYHFSIQAENDSYNLTFNFCQFIKQGCNADSVKYFLSMDTSSSCINYTENNPKKENYNVIDKNGITGLQILYQDVNDDTNIIEMNLICNKSIKKFTIKDITREEKKIVLNIENDLICPQIISNLIYDSLSYFKLLFFIIGIIIGPIELFIGHKVFGVTVFLMGFILSASFILLLLDVFILENDSNSYWVYFLAVLGILLSGIIGLILVKVKNFGIIICGATAGFFLCLFSNYLFLYKIESTPSYVS